MRRVRVFVTLVLLALTPGASRGQHASSPPATPAAWRPVERALARTGQMQPGDIFRVGFARTDLHVMAGKVVLKPAFALGSWAAFSGSGNQAMVMGDLVLLETEIDTVMTRLFAAGFEVSGLHNHLIATTPAIMYLHYEGHGRPEVLARGLCDALNASGTPATPPPSVMPAKPEFDPVQIERILGRTGKVIGDGVYQVSVPRPEKITEGGMTIPPAMGVAIPLNFQSLGGRRAAVTGDFVLLANEVNPVARALRAHHIEVTALHNHMLRENPRLFFMHFWATGDVVDLATGLRAALDRTAAAEVRAAGSHNSK